MSQDKTIVYYKDTSIGNVYRSSHGVWVAELNADSIFSRSFLTEDAAKSGLIEYFLEIKG